MEEELEIYFVGYESDVQKAIKNQVYLTLDEAAKVYRYASNIVGLEGIRIFRARLVIDREPVLPDTHKLFKSM